MNRPANLFATVNVSWCDRHWERECEVEVDYTYDGEVLKIGKCSFLGNTDSADDDDLENQIWEAVEQVCDEAYAEWLADYGEYLRDAAEDRRAA